MKQVNEDDGGSPVPVNSASSGGIDGLDNNPPVNRKKKSPILFSTFRRKIKSKGAANA